MERRVPVMERRSLQETVFQLLKRQLTALDEQDPAETKGLGRELVRSGASYADAATAAAEAVLRLAREFPETSLAVAAPGLTAALGEILTAYAPASPRDGGRPNAAASPDGQEEAYPCLPGQQPTCKRLQQLSEGLHGRPAGSTAERVEEVAQRVEELARANAELEDITYVVSHDLKEPLRGIEAFSAFLEEDYGDDLKDEGKRYVRVVRRNAARMKQLIEDLLELSRIVRLEPNLEPVDVASVIAEAREDLHFTLEEKAVDLRIQPGLPTVTCDPVRLREVFHNLLSNAAKFNDKPEPIVEISYSDDDDQHVFTVRDNGIGIEEGYRGRIFKLFQRLNRREDYEGTGAGLAICKKIVEAHAGQIWVESEPGVGSAFSFTVPKYLQPTEHLEGERQDG